MTVKVPRWDRVGVLGSLAMASLRILVEVPCRHVRSSAGRPVRGCAAFKGEQHLLLIGASSDIIASPLHRFCVFVVYEILKNR